MTTAESETTSAAPWDAVRSEVTAFLSERWDPAMTVREWWSELTDSRWGFPTWPEEWFGRSLSPSLQWAVDEAFAAFGALGPPESPGQSLGGRALLAFGDDDQRRRFLPRLARGEEYWCQLFSEPNAGSDLASLQTKAVRDGNVWRVEGQKIWTSLAHLADRGLLLARTDPDAPKHQGITLFVIDMDQPGIELRPIPQMNERREFNQVFFDGAIVNSDRVMGEVNEGWRVATTALSVERHTAGGYVGVAPGTRAGLLDERAGAVAGGEVVGPRIGLVDRNLSDLVIRASRALESIDDPAVRDDLVRVHILSEVNRLVYLRARAAAVAGVPAGQEGSVVKLILSQRNRLARDVGLRVLGSQSLLAGPGTVLDGAIQQMALTVPALSIGAGTDEIQKNVLAERGLGLPREPKPAGATAGTER